MSALLEGKLPLRVAYSDVQGIGKASIQCPSLPDSWSQSTLRFRPIGRPLR